MALKDWRIIIWDRKSRVSKSFWNWNRIWNESYIYFWKDKIFKDELCVWRKSEGKYDVVYWVGYGGEWGETLYSSKSKSQALKFAKSYMRTH